MTHYFSAQISQEHSENVRNLALSLNIPQERIVFNTAGCFVGTIGVYIKFDDKCSLDEFTEKIMQSIPCVIQKW